MEIKWETIDDWHQRAKVYGGWLIKAYEPVSHNLIAEGQGVVSGWDYRIALCFIPDDGHLWGTEE